MLVFARTKRSADRLAHDLTRRGVRASALHGDLSQERRLRAMDNFRYGESQVMVATDIAARGIDIDEISHVINFEVPNSPDDYIHRIGRTARAEATGDAFTLVDKEEEPMIQEIEQTLHRTLPRVTLPYFNYRRPAGPSGREERRRHSRGGSAPHRGGYRRR